MSPTRVLVVGPYPPTEDRLGDAVLADVRTRRRAGAQVEVCSLEPSAAHHHADLSTPSGMLVLARLTRDVDCLVVHYRPEGFEHSPGGLRTTVATRVLSAAVGRVGSVEVVVHRTDRDAGPVLEVLQAVAGDSVRLEAGAADREPSAPDDWPDGLDAVQAMVRNRATRDRARVTGDVFAQLRAVSPLRLTVPVSARPGVTAVRRVMQRLVAWEMDPLVGQVNRLRTGLVALSHSEPDDATHSEDE